MGGCIWRGQGPKSVGPCPTRGEVLPLDGARVQPRGHVRLPAAHSRLRHLGHGLSRAGGAGVHPLEVLGWSQLHLALHWGTGSHSFVIQFFVLWIILSVPRTDGRCLWRTSTSASMAASGSGGRTRGPNTMTSHGQL